jgi:hypothetical protein
VGSDDRATCILAEETASPILSAITGTNARLLAHAFGLFVRTGSRVVDLTYGRGVWWQELNEGDYRVVKYDLHPADDQPDVRQADFRWLAEYEADDSADVALLDPPYMHGGRTVKESINRCYGNENASHESIVRLYAGGLLECARILKQRGKVLVKCQDETESNRQRLSHVELIQLLRLFGFRILDLLVLIQKTTPAMRYDFQKTARKNHSFLLVAEFRR